MHKWFIVYQGREGNLSSAVGPFATKLDAETYLGVVSSRAKLMAPGAYHHQERRAVIGKKGVLLKVGFGWVFRDESRIELVS